MCKKKYWVSMRKPVENDLLFSNKIFEGGVCAVWTFLIRQLNKSSSMPHVASVSNWLNSGSWSCVRWLWIGLLHFPSFQKFKIWALPSKKGPPLLSPSMQQASLKSDKTRHGAEEQTYLTGFKISLKARFFAKVSTLAGSLKKVGLYLLVGQIPGSP